MYVYSIKKSFSHLFPLSSDLPRDAVLAITILDVYSPKEDAIVGGTAITLFGKSGNFRSVPIYSEVCVRVA